MSELDLNAMIHKFCFCLKKIMLPLLNNAGFAAQWFC